MTAVEVTLPSDPFTLTEVATDTLAPQGLEQLAAEPTFAERAKTFIALSYTSIAAFFAEQGHLAQQFPQPWQAISESMSHPVLGYMAAWLAATAVKHGWLEKSGAAALAATAALDVIAEEGQDLILGPGPGHWWAASQWFESGKDGGFALGGMAAFIGQGMVKGWWQQRRETAALNEQSVTE